MTDPLNSPAGPVHPLGRQPRKAGRNPGHRQWTKILGTTGFTVDTLHELYAPPGAEAQPYYYLVTTHWAAQWPVEDLWAAHLPVPGASRDG
jgi:hypothetical protein